MNTVPLATSAFDRAALHRTDDAWLADAWQRAKVVVISPGSAAPVDGSALALRSAADLPPDVTRRFLGVRGEDVFFTVTLEPDDSGTWRTLRELGGGLGELDSDLFDHDVFARRFYDKGRVSSYVRDIPVFKIVAAEPEILGLSTLFD